jgi:diguanylate cyclase (GGDEF)-like protein/PAS domain S-box-containing protein
VIDGTTDLVVAFDEEGKLSLANQAFQNVLGYRDPVEKEMTIWQFVEGSQIGTLSQAIQEGAAGHSRQLQIAFRSQRGSVIEVEGALSFVSEGGKRITRAIFRDVSSRVQAERALRAANDALERLAATDALTGIANRRVFDQHLAEETSRARRAGTPLSVAMIDVDCFKLYNDHYGHQQGDECLRSVAGSLASVARRAGELAARYGGEEFALVLPGLTLDQAVRLAEQARAKVAELALPHPKNSHGVVTVSVGVASYDPVKMDGPEALLVAADEALYRAKSLGRNRIDRAA